MSAYDERDRERWVGEPPKRPGRSDFARDRARVVHSAGLRRLAAKTQVVGPGSHDSVRNRLTHTLEVAQVGRELARVLGCDADLVDTACLAHDLGHPPFGHNGEAALDEAARACGGFEGNAQTLRVLTRLEAKVLRPAAAGRTASAGLNLTRASLDGATKYPWRRGAAVAAQEAQEVQSGQTAQSAQMKFGAYDADAEVFAWLREGAPEAHPCVEAQVMDLADDVAYSVHDVEDAIVSARLDPAALAAGDVRASVADLAAGWYLPGADPAALLAALDRLRALPCWVPAYDGGRRALAALKDLTSQLIGRFCARAEEATFRTYGPGPLRRYAADLVVPADTQAEIAVLKGVAAFFVMTAEDRQEEYVRQREVLRELVVGVAHRSPDVLEPVFREDWQGAADDPARLRVVVDQVASLTDASAVAWHARLCP